MSRVYLQILIAASLFLEQFPHAQAKPAIEEVSVIATRAESPVTSLPGNISLLDAETLDLLGANHIQQALNQLPGVGMQRGNGQESLPSIRSAVLTGAGACGNILVMEEAIPVRGVGFCNVNELFDTHFEQAERIAVVRGTNSAFFGSNALSGSVNISLPSKGDDELAVELGANEYFRGKGAVSYGDSANHDAQGRFYATITHDGGYRDDSGFNQQKLSWRNTHSTYNWQLKSGFTATRLDQETAGFIVGKDSYIDRELATQNLDPEGFRKTGSFRAWTRAKRKLSDKTEIALTPYMRVTNMDFLLHFLPGDPLEHNKQIGIGLQSSLATDALDEFRWVMGFDADISNGELKQTQDGPTQGPAFLQETIPSGTHYDYKVDAAQLAMFLHADWDINQHWRMITGLRWESVRYDYNNRTLSGRTRDDGSECGFGGCRYSRPADRRDSFSHISPKFELQYRPSNAWKWKVAVANSFRSPQATELYRLQRAQSVADLDNVNATHIDLGLHWQSSQSKAELSVYQIQQRNVIVRDSDFFNVDGARIKSRGLEFSSAARFSEHWRVTTAVTFARHNYDSDFLSGGASVAGNDVDTAPRLYGNLRLLWQPTQKCVAELETLYISEYYLEPENIRKYPGHTLINARVQLQLNESLNASIRALNVGDKRYAERADYTSFTQERYFPGEPPSVFVQLELRI